MKIVPLHLNYEMNERPIGFVIFDDNVPDDVIREGAIVPYLRKETYDETFVTTGFGLVPRTTVDTRESSEL